PCSSPGSASSSTRTFCKASIRFDSDHAESAPQIICCVVGVVDAHVVDAHIIDQILMHKGLRRSLRNSERTRRSHNQYPLGGLRQSNQRTHETLLPSDSRVAGGGSRGVW